MTAAVIEWATAALPMPGETVSGDAVVIETWADGALVALIDALGHGPEANEAASIATTTLRRRPADSPENLLQECHQALRRTRGIAITLASFDSRADRMTWVGIGNIESFLYRSAPNARPARESILLRGGIVGYHIPTPKPSTISLFPGDTLVAATDGLAGGFAEDYSPIHDLAQNVDRIFLAHRKGSDDALVVLARYLGGRP